MRLLADLGFDLEAGRQDRSAHPFSTTIALHDVRVTTRTDEADPFSAIFSTIHEAGHGMYDQGFDPAFEDTPLADAPSLGAHESQSRLWENIVGRSLPFWEHYAPVMSEMMGGSLGAAGASDVFRHVNRVTPSLIRVEADEVTYNLHVLVRFELERRLMREELTVAELPEAWNEAYLRRLGIRVPHVGDGVLQDVHWSEGAFGYFPTYTLGNLYSAMLWRTIRADLPDIEADIGIGRFDRLLCWLRDHVHTPGYLYETGELMTRITGSELSHEPFMDYLWDKFGPLYGVSDARG
jgi:carboxypeptidase Taq